MSGNSTPNDDEPGILIEPVDSRTDAERARAQEMTWEEMRKCLDDQRDGELLEILRDENRLDAKNDEGPEPPNPGSTPSNVRKLRP
jgi:hypothetical protein